MSRWVHLAGANDDTDSQSFHGDNMRLGTDEEEDQLRSNTSLSRSPSRVPDDVRRVSRPSMSFSQSAQRGIAGPRLNEPPLLLRSPDPELDSATLKRKDQNDHSSGPARKRSRQEPFHIPGQSSRAITGAPTQSSASNSYLFSPPRPSARLDREEAPLRAQTHAKRRKTIAGTQPEFRCRSPSPDIEQLSASQPPQAHVRPQRRQTLPGRPYILERFPMEPPKYPKQPSPRRLKIVMIKGYEHIDISESPEPDEVLAPQPESLPEMLVKPETQKARPERLTPLQQIGLDRASEHVEKFLLQQKPRRVSTSQPVPAPQRQLPIPKLQTKASKLRGQFTHEDETIDILSTDEDEQPVKLSPSKRQQQVPRRASSEEKRSSNVVKIIEISDGDEPAVQQSSREVIDLTMFDDEPSTTPPRIEQPVSTPTTPDRHNFGIFGPNLVSNDSSSSNLERSVRDWNDTPRPKAMKRVVQHSQSASPTSSSVGRQSTGSGASAGPATTNGSRSSASPPTALLAESRHTNASPMERAYQPWGEEEYEEEIGQMDENDELEFDDDVPPMSGDDNAPLQSEELSPTNASPMAQAEHQLTPQNEDDEDDSLWAIGPEYVDPKEVLVAQPRSTTTQRRTSPVIGSALTSNGAGTSPPDLATPRSVTLAAASNRSPFSTKSPGTFQPVLSPATIGLSRSIAAPATGSSGSHLTSSPLSSILPPSSVPGTSPSAAPTHSPAYIRRTNPFNTPTIFPESPVRKKKPGPLDKFITSSATKASGAKAQGGLQSSPIAFKQPLSTSNPGRHNPNTTAAKAASNVPEDVFGAVASNVAGPPLDADQATKHNADVVAQSGIPLSTLKSVSEALHAGSLKPGEEHATACIPAAARAPEPATQTYTQSSPSETSKKIVGEVVANHFMDVYNGSAKPLSALDDDIDIAMGISDDSVPALEVRESAIRGDVELTRDMEAVSLGPMSENDEDDELDFLSERRRTRSMSRSSDNDHDDELTVVRGRTSRRATARPLQQQQLFPVAPQPILTELRPSMSDPDVQRLQRSAALVRAARNIRWPGETVDTLMLDAIAQLHPHNLTDPNLRAVFQATLDRCDEPHADLEKIRITVENQIDAEPCPPFEFHYTNSLVYGNNVHRGEPARLKGCGCEGGCKPDSKTCACLRTQNMYWKIFGFAAGFNVDAEGCVVDPGFPIFECNEACGCDETCMNRVVQRGRQYSVVIRKTLRKGWGVFAQTDIPARSYLGIYAGELITLNESDHRGDIYDIFGRTYQFTVDFWYLQQGYRRIIRRIREGGAPGAFDADETIFPTFCVDAFHVGNFTRFLNHSCDPNCVVVAVHINEPHIYKPFMCLFTNKALKAGEEFTFNYGGAQGGDDQPRQKKKGRGKKNGGLKDKACHCGASKCTGRFF